MPPATRRHALRQSALAGRVTRYTLGSIVAAAVSTVIFALLYVVGVGTTACSVSAFAAGAVPNWYLNRRWAWRRHGRPVFSREIAAYALTSIVSLVAASAATAWTKSEAQVVSTDHGIRVLLVTGSYLAVFATLFVAKFVVYEHWIFSGRSRVRPALRARLRGLTAARANRIP